MPWTTKADVARHNKNAANDPALRKQWKKIANGHLKKHPDDEAGAIKIANGVIRKRMHEETQHSNIIPDREILSEFNLRSLGHNIVNRTLAKLGSGAAQGRVDRQETLDELMNRFNTFLSHQRLKPTFSSFLTFLSDNFGRSFAVDVRRRIENGTFGVNGGSDTEQFSFDNQETSNSSAPEDSANSVNATSNATNTETPASNKTVFKSQKLNDLADNTRSVNGEKGFYADRAKQAGINANTRNYQHNTFKELTNLVSSPKQDVRQIATLTKEILAHANDHGGQDKARVMAYLKALRKNPRVLANPKLAGMFTGLKLESIRRTIDMAMFLVENNIKTKRGLTEAVTKFFLIEKPFGNAPNNSGRPVYDNNVNNQAFGRKPATTPDNAPGAAGLRARYNARYGNQAPTGSAAPIPPNNVTQNTTNTPSNKPQASKPIFDANQVLSRKQLVQYFGGVASILLRQGKVSFNDKRQTRNTNNDDNENEYYRKTSSGRYKPVSEPSLKKSAPATNSAATSSFYDTVAYKFKKQGLDRDKAVQTYLSLVRQNRSGKEIANTLKQDGLSLSPEAIGVIHSAMGH